MKKIYIMLSKTGTLPSRLIHISLKGSYTHASIALTPDTGKLYSFARRTLNNPLNAGFLTEDTQTFVFAKFASGSCAVYSLPIEEEAYKKIETLMQEFIDNKDKYDYNFLGAIPARLGIVIKRKYKFTCSQFVAYVLDKSNAVNLPKHYSLMMPDDFLKLDGIELVYSGTIGKCKIDYKEQEQLSTVDKK